ARDLRGRPPPDRRSAPGRPGPVEPARENRPVNRTRHAALPGRPRLFFWLERIGISDEDRSGSRCFMTGTEVPARRRRVLKDAFHETRGGEPASFRTPASRVGTSVPNKQNDGTARVG